jgi:hypothetical protein
MPSSLSPTTRAALWADPEINAAAQLSFDSSRTAALDDIARKPELCPQSQVLLVQKVYSRLDYETSKMQVLRTLIQNPGFSNAAKAQIINGLGHLSYDTSRSEVLALINNRGALAW